MITVKNKLLQILCRHKNKDWFKEKGLLKTISGEKHYYVCKDCGKVLDERFLEYEGMGFK